MMLESREGEVAAVPFAVFRAGLNPTDADLQGFYPANRNRYMVPEQRVLRLARIGPEQVAGVGAVRPGDRGLLQRQQGDLWREGHADAEPGGGPRPGDGGGDRGEGPGRRDDGRGGRRRRGDVAQGPDPRGLCRGRRRQGRGGGVRRGAGRGRRAGPVRLRLGRRQGRIRSRRSAASRSTRPSPRLPPSSPPTSASRRSRISSTSSRTRSTKAAISPKRRPRPSCR